MTYLSDIVASGLFHSESLNCVKTKSCGCEAGRMCRGPSTSLNSATTALCEQYRLATCNTSHRSQTVSCKNIWIQGENEDPIDHLISSDKISKWLTSIYKRTASSCLTLLHTPLMMRLTLGTWMVEKLPPCLKVSLVRDSDSLSLLSKAFFPFKKLYPTMLTFIRS
jgi:hypothetical protein